MDQAHAEVRTRYAASLASHELIVVVELRRLVTVVLWTPRSLAASLSALIAQPVSSSPSREPERSMSVSFACTTSCPVARHNLRALSRPSPVLCSNAHRSFPPSSVNSVSEPFTRASYTSSTMRGNWVSSGLAARPEPISVPCASILVFCLVWAHTCRSCAV
jgi:hypothetical protein